MRRLRAWIVRLGGLLHSGRRERELRAEIESHLQLHIDHNIRAGMTPDEARRAALVRFGHLEAIKDEYRERLGVPQIATLVQDVRYAVRRWAHRPGFALTAILILGLGIAGTTAIFSIVDAVLLRPLPWTEPDKLVVIHAVHPQRARNPASAATWNRGLFSFLAWDAMRASPVFEDVAVWRRAPLDTTFGPDRTVIVPTAHVSANFLPMLGVSVVAGRHFTQREGEQNTDSIILTHECWERRFGADPQIVGQQIMLGSASAGGRYPKRVVGVLEPGFRFDGAAPEILMPVGIFARAGRTYPGNMLRVVARLASGSHLESAQALAQAVARTVETREPTSARIVPLVEEALGRASRPLWLLFGGAGLLLLVACFSVAGLLLAERRVRRREIAIRAALGGSRGRVMRQLAIEHLVLAAAGAVAGLMMARWLTRALIAAAPENIPRLETVSMDWRVAAFALLAGAVTGLLFGVAPAISLARTPAAETLAEGGRSTTLARLIGQRTIVAAEIGLALVLVTVAALFGETLYRLTSRPLGFDASRVAVISTRFTGWRWGNPEQHKRALELRGSEDFSVFMQKLQRATTKARNDAVFQRLTALPGVVHVAGASAVPFAVAPREITVQVDGRPADEEYSVQRQLVTPGYFRTMGMPILDGRDFRPSDDSHGTVAIVSRELQRRLLGDRPIGRRLTYVWGSQPAHRSTYTVIGVVDDVKQREFLEEYRPRLYVLDPDVAQFLVRTTGPAGAILTAVRQAIAEVDPQIVVTSTTTLEDALSASIAEERFRAMLSALFGGAALVLAAVALYGLAARRVAERRREIGVRVALGATPAHVRWLVLRDGAMMVTAGVLCGLPGAWTAGQVTRSFLFGVSPAAPHVLLLAAGVLAAAALLAMMLPAYRASRIDPMRVLRAEG